MKEKFFSILRHSLVYVIVFLAFFGAARVLAAGSVTQDINDQLNASAGPTGAGYAYRDPRVLVSNIIEVALGLIGTIMFVLIVYAGFLWMTAQGNGEQVEHAQGIIRTAVIGLIVVLAAYSITIIVTNLAIGRPLWYGTTNNYVPY